MGLDAAAVVVRNGAYKTFVGFVNALSPILKPIRNLLERKLTVSVPWPVKRKKTVCVKISYPCGTKTCKAKTWVGTIYYPCGMKWCKKKGCGQISYPWFEQRSFSFSVSD